MASENFVHVLPRETGKTSDQIVVANFLGEAHRRFTSHLLRQSVHKTKIQMFNSCLLSL